MRRLVGGGSVFSAFLRFCFGSENLPGSHVSSIWDRKCSVTPMFWRGARNGAYHNLSKIERACQASGVRNQLLFVPEKSKSVF